MEDERCPLCGCEEIGIGYFDGYGGLTTPRAILPVGETVIASVCTECGYIIEMKVSNPSKFKLKRK